MKAWRSAILSALGIVALAIVVVPFDAPVATAKGCDIARPSTCTLAEVARAAGIRVGTTLEADETTLEPYATTAAREFTSVTPENALKWYVIHNTPDLWNFGPGDTVVDFAVAHGMEVRGHNLVWAQDTYTPAWVRALSPNDLRTTTDQYIRAVIDHFKDRVHRWDVVNEPLESLGTEHSQSVYWSLGPNWIADVFRTAHAADPTAQLWLNEFGTDWVPGKQRALLRLVRGLLQAKVPIDGIGIQMHRLPGLAVRRQTLERQFREFTALGLQVAVTEVDVPTDPSDPNALQFQARQYGEITQACLDVAGCTEVTTWGLTDARTWLASMTYYPQPSRPLLFDDDYRPKPAYDRVRRTIAHSVGP